MNQLQTRQPTSLYQFVRTLKNLDGPASLKMLKSLLRTLNPEDPRLMKYCRFSEDKYQRNLIAEGTWFEALLLCFEAGQKTPIHDHAGSACGVRVIRGAATEVSFETTSAGRLHPTQSSQLNTNGVVGSLDMDIHQLSNMQPDNQRLVTLHVYSPPLGVVGNYSIVDNTCRRVRAKCNRPTDHII